MFFEGLLHRGADTEDGGKPGSVATTGRRSGQRLAPTNGFLQFPPSSSQLIQNTSDLSSTMTLYNDGLGHKPFKSGQANFTER